MYLPAHLSISRSDLEMRGNESIWLELRYPRSRLCLFSFICRPPSADASLPERMDLMLTKVDYKVYRSCMLGDFNIDLFSKSVLHKRSIASTKAYGFHQLMSVSTRPVCETLLNLVLVNCTDNVLESGTLLLTLSDHLPIFVSPKSKAIKQQSRGHKPALCRS